MILSHAVNWNELQFEIFHLRWSFFKQDKQGISSKRCEFPCPQQRITFFFPLMHAFQNPQKTSVVFFSFFNTLAPRLASTRAEFEQTATGLLTKLEKGLQSAQEAPFFHGKSREWIATSQQNTFWSCFCEQRSSTLPFSSGVFFFLLATKLTELFLLLPLTMFLLRKLQIWKDFLHTQVVEGVCSTWNPKQSVYFVDVWWFPTILHVMIWLKIIQLKQSTLKPGLFGVPLPRGGSWSCLEAHQRVQEAMGNYRRSSIQVRETWGSDEFLIQTFSERCEVWDQNPGRGLGEKRGWKTSQLCRDFL